jgi:putative SOS response-associated peptidase YedK
MPVILAENWDAWLDAPRKDLLVPASDADLQRWRVTEKMNASTYKEAESVEPIDGYE